MVGGGAGLYSSMPIVAGNTLISSSTLQGVVLLMVLVASGSFKRVTRPLVT